ncbi:MAG: NAD(P)H-hydrate dehydratase [Haloferacaceae archaeon]
MITTARMAAVDRNAAALGVPQRALMESSGRAVADAVRAVADPGDAVAVVCGRGNNGGDGAVAARHLSGFDRTAYLLGRPETMSTEIARANWTALSRAEADARAVTDSRALDLGDPDVVVDAMLGTGATGAPREPAATAIQRVNASGATVVSVDVPSGIDADTGTAAGDAVDPDRVVTFHDDKPGLAAYDVTVADIGIPAAAERFVGPGDLPATRSPTAHKGDGGEVLVVGGGPYTGAPALAAQAAMRAGADLVRVACPRGVAREVQSYEPGLIVEPFDADLLTAARVPDLLDRAAAHDAVVLGPGVGAADATAEAAGDFLAAFDGRAVVDADALGAVPETDATLVCTPHAGEARAMGADLPGDADRERREAATAALAAEYDATVLLKGRHDAVATAREGEGPRTRVSRTGTPAMTVGGTGDVLAGVTGALLAVSEPFAAACAAVYANGIAGERAADGRDRGLVAADLLAELPAALGGEGGDRI